MSRRIRRHANPFNVPTRLGRLDLDAQFGRTAPIEVDIGCGGGRFLIRRAQNQPDTDFIGFEIRKPLVEATMHHVQRLGLKNLVFFYANAQENLRELVEPGVIRRFYVMFPDPCFKKRHWKRRIMQPNLVRTMAELLPLQGEVFAQSDVRPLAQEMFDFLARDQAFESRLAPDLSSPSPFDEQTEWETHHAAEGDPVYRMLFQKVRAPTGDILPPEYRDTNPKRVNNDGSLIKEEG